MLSFRSHSLNSFWVWVSSNLILQLYTITLESFHHCRGITLKIVIVVYHAVHSWCSWKTEFSIFEFWSDCQVSCWPFYTKTQRTKSYVILVLFLLSFFWRKRTVSTCRDHLQMILNCTLHKKLLRHSHKLLATTTMLSIFLPAIFLDSKITSFTSQDYCGDFFHFCNVQMYVEHLLKH